METIKIYYPYQHYNKEYRAQVFPLLKPFFKNQGFSDQDRINLYGISEKDITFSNNINEADIVILPMSWNYYVMTNQVYQAEKIINEANKYKLKVLVTITGDYGVDIPSYGNVYVTRTSGYRSKLSNSHQGAPVFISDPLKRIYNKTTPVLNYAEKPIVGFCGQTNDSVTNAVKEIVKVVYRNLNYYLKRNKKLPQKIQSTTYNRSRVLNAVKKSVKLSPNFIERKKYRAGGGSAIDREKTEREFYDNMMNSNYIICVRGAGNFSVRLYETLAMGRIPVFINTDCLLPLPNTIDWKKYVVWVEYDELNKIEEKIEDFHSKFSPDEFKKLQNANRKLWEEQLTLKGFFTSYLNTTTV